jgi:hypothetical protein
MQRWEYFLAADRRLDLSDVERAREWAFPDAMAQLERAKEQAQAAGQRGPGFVLRDFKDQVPIMATSGIVSTSQKPNREDAAEWGQLVRALRSLAGREADYRGRAAEIDPTEADAILDRHLRLMEPRVLIGPKPIKKIRTRFHPRPEAWRMATESFAAAASLYFQFLFASLVQPDGVCGSCGRDLPPTGPGQASRARRCRTCKKKAWLQSLTPARRREIERERKQRQRARLKSPPKKGK